MLPDELSLLSRAHNGLWGSEIADMVDIRKFSNVQTWSVRYLQLCVTKLLVGLFYTETLHGDHRQMREQPWPGIRII